MTQSVNTGRYLRGENKNNFCSIMSFISSFTTNIASKRSCSCLRFDGSENAAIIEHLRAHVFAFFFFLNIFLKRVKGRRKELYDR